MRDCESLVHVCGFGLLLKPNLCMHGRDPGGDESSVFFCPSACALSCVIFVKHTAFGEVLVLVTQLAQEFG